ncbi:MAG: ubiquitin-binding protein cue5 [Sclerophora amabilis]|nr:MAG: ubiquitin-binding protein cue5 [Sclerophora amabilis]
MADSKSSDRAVSPTKTSSGAAPESPTTARELDFDDEPNDSANISNDPNAVPGATNSAGFPKPGSGEDAAPPKPPRPMSPQQQAETTLREAFPNIDRSVVKAVLTASSGKIEPAFTALLSMSDPESQNEAPPPVQPSRPVATPLASHGLTSTSQNQLEADEMYARQLAEHYSGTAFTPGARGGSRTGSEQAVPRPKRETNLKPSELYDDDHSFFDDDLPVIKENIRKGFLETQTKVNKWVTDFKKRLDGEDEEEPERRQTSQGYNPGPSRPPYGSRRSGELGSRSVDRDRYDADPKVLGDDFAALELRDEEVPPPRPTRPLANPNLFKPTPATPPSSGSRKVSFQEGPPEDIGGSRKTSPRPQSSPGGGGKQSKWQPLSTVDPIPAVDNDPFSLGDSDDDREAKSRDLKSEDTERLKKAAAEAMSDDIGTGTKKTGLEEHAKTGPQGTKDKEAEEKLTG